MLVTCNLSLMKIWKKISTSKHSAIMSISWYCRRSGRPSMPRPSNWTSSKAKMVSLSSMVLCVTLICLLANLKDFCYGLTISHSFWNRMYPMMKSWNIIYKTLTMVHNNMSRSFISLSTGILKSDHSMNLIMITIEWKLIICRNCSKLINWLKI